MIPRKDDEPRLIVEESPKEAGPVSARSRAFSFIEMNFEHFGRVLGGASSKFFAF